MTFTFDSLLILMLAAFVVACIFDIAKVFTPGTPAALLVTATTYLLLAVHHAPAVRQLIRARQDEPDAT